MAACIAKPVKAPAARQPEDAVDLHKVHQIGQAATGAT